MKLDKEGGLQPEIAAFGGCRLPPRAAQKHAKRAVPAGTKDFLSYFLCLTKSMESRGAAKGFNFVSAKLLFGWADSRFAEPRCSLQRERIVTFCVVQKVTKKHAGLRPATSIQISARFKILAEITGHHQVTGRAGYCKVSGYRR